jgi:pyruvate-ferredoxin/flavodoxin oxidoreductase
MGMSADPVEAERLIALAQQDIDDQWHYYEQMAGVERELAKENGEVLSCALT